PTSSVGSDTVGGDSHVKVFQMKSPFPGMDPYIEATGLLGDFHTHLIERIYDCLAQSAPERYLVRAGERSYVVLVESEGETTHPFMPDVSVTSSPSRQRADKPGTVALAEPSSGIEPKIMRAFIEEEHREAF